MCGLGCKAHVALCGACLPRWVDLTGVQDQTTSSSCLLLLLLALLCMQICEDGNKSVLLLQPRIGFWGPLYYSYHKEPPK